MAIEIVIILVLITVYNRNSNRNENHNRKSMKISRRTLNARVIVIVALNVLVLKIVRAIVIASKY